MHLPILQTSANPARERAILLHRSFLHFPIPTNFPHHAVSSSQTQSLSKHPLLSSGDPSLTEPSPIKYPSKASSRKQLSLSHYIEPLRLTAPDTNTIFVTLPRLSRPGMFKKRAQVSPYTSLTSPVERRGSALESMR